MPAISGNYTSVVQSLAWILIFSAFAMVATSDLRVDIDIQTGITQ